MIFVYADVFDDDIFDAENESEIEGGLEFYQKYFSVFTIIQIVNFLILTVENRKMKVIQNESWKTELIEVKNFKKPVNKRKNFEPKVFHSNTIYIYSI